MQDHLNEIESQLREINDWFDQLDPDKMPTGISPAQFSYLIYRLARAYGIDTALFTDCAAVAASNIALAERRRAEN